VTEQALKFRVRVPATSGNLGPGFDALGLAYQLYDDVEVTFAAAPTSQQSKTEVSVTGEGAGTVAKDDTHLVVQAIRQSIARAGVPQPNIVLNCYNRIPHGRGLGSSAAAVVAGITAAQAYLYCQVRIECRAKTTGDHRHFPGVIEQIPVDRAETLIFATEFEGHPDNAAPAIYGGATVAWFDQVLTPKAAKLQISPDIVPTLLIPPTTLATKKARAALPTEVPHQDAAFNAGRAALLVAALANQPALLYEATSDRLHQGYRAKQMPTSAALLAKLRQAGVAVVVSGAGPTLLALTTTTALPELDMILKDIGVLKDDPQAADWRVIRPGIDAQGVVCRRLS